MGKRSNFERKPKDFYKTTDPNAVFPLCYQWDHPVQYHEPCAGDGSLIGLLNEYGHQCKEAGDIEPAWTMIPKKDATKLDYCAGDMFITNPPWTRPILHELIEHLGKIAPAWLLFDADWMHTRQASPYLEYCHEIVSVGRVKWFEESNSVGKDNCAWYRFDYSCRSFGPVFRGRIA